MMERYEEYKDSGVEWIGEIPDNWEVRKLVRAVVKLTNGYVGPTRNIMRPAGIPYIQGIHIKNNTIKFTPIGSYYVDKEWSDNHNKSILKTNDLLVVQTGTIGDVGIVPAKFEGANCHALLIVRANSLILFPKYFLYFLTSPFGYASLQQIKTGEILFHINGSKLKGIDILLPPEPQQTIIANYLDRKTTEIDKLIAQKERLLKLYEEEKIAIINQAITKGIDTDAKLKDSGIDWLGEIPEHWGVVELRRLISNITSGSRGWAKYYSDEGMIFIRIGNLTRHSIDVDLSDIQYVVPPTGTESERTIIFENDILFSITAYIGSVALATNEVVGAYISQHVALVRPLMEKIFPKYVAYAAFSDSGQSQLRGQGYGGTKLQLALDDVRSLLIPIPPLHEQTKIAEYIEIEITRINAKIAKTKKIISLQKEYRTALISEVVTGKIKVTQEAAP